MTTTTIDRMWNLLAEHADRVPASAQHAWAEMLAAHAAGDDEQTYRKASTAARAVHDARPVNAPLTGITWAAHAARDAAYGTHVGNRKVQRRAAAEAIAELKKMADA